MIRMDPIREWREAQQRVATLVTEAGEDATSTTTVPACPAWSARDLLAHMIGLDADISAHGEPDEYGEDWTDRQIREREGVSVRDLLTEWDGVADRLTDWMARNNSNPLNDVIIHEQDLRGALGVPGAQDTPALVAIRDDLASGFAKAVESKSPIALRGTTWQWTSHEGAEPETIVEASDFDLARALCSRRSANQLRSWTVRGDVGPYLDAFAALGSLPDDDLAESD